MSEFEHEQEQEQERVLCEECGQMSAVCTVAVMMGTKVLHRKLCQACMAKASMSIASGNIGKVLGAIMQAARSAAQEAAAALETPVEEAAEPAAESEAAPSEAQAEENTPEMPPQADMVCPQCGTSLGSCLKTRRIGCARCYSVFREHLQLPVDREGQTLMHVGRSPLRTRAAQADRLRWEKLQRQLDEAVAREDYESAAKLRDELRLLHGEEGGSDA